jgi:hypothetical protein
MALVVGRLRGRRHGAAGTGGGEKSRGWHGSDWAEGRSRPSVEHTQTDDTGRDGATSALGFGSRRCVFSSSLCCCAAVFCDGGLGWELGFPLQSSAFVYVTGLVRRGHLPVCVAYGHLSLSFFFPRK